MTIESIQNLQKTIDTLLDKDSGGFVWGDRDTPANTWIIEPLYEEDDCSMGFVHIKDKNFGACGEHIHPESKEFLIVVSGSILLNVDGKDMRVVKEGECCVVEKAQSHFSRPLEDKTKIAYICVPQDRFLKKIGNIKEKYAV